MFVKVHFALTALLHLTTAVFWDGPQATAIEKRATDGFRPTPTPTFYPKAKGDIHRGVCGDYIIGNLSNPVSNVVDCGGMFQCGYINGQNVVACCESTSHARYVSYYADCVGYFPTCTTKEVNSTLTVKCTQSQDTTCWGGARGGCNSRNPNGQGGPTSYSHLITPAANGAFVVAGPGPTSVWTIRPNGTRFAPSSQPTVTVTNSIQVPAPKVTSGADFNKASRVLFAAASAIPHVIGPRRIRVSLLLGLAIFRGFVYCIRWITTKVFAIVAILYFALLAGLKGLILD